MEASQCAKQFVPLLLVYALLFSLSSLLCAASDSDYSNLVHCLTKHSCPNGKITSIIYSPQNSSYTSVLQAYIKTLRFNTSTTPKPIIIVTPLQESLVTGTILCAKSMGIQLKIRSGGHDYDGISYVSDEKFIILEMFNLRLIDVNIEKETAWVQAGATLGELYYRIWEKSTVHGFPAGVCPTVGVGGHLSGGGYRNMLRKFGLSIDNVIDAHVGNKRDKGNKSLNT